MKSIILVILVAFSGYFPTANNSAEMEEEFGPKIDVSMELGRKSRGCSGFGICSISGKTSFQVKGTFELSENTKNMGNFEIQRIMITKIPREVGQTHFYVNGKLSSYYNIAESLKSELKIDGKKSTVTLKSGRYRLTKTSGGYTLSR